MPELPEVETIVRDLAPYLCGRRVVSVEVIAGLVVKAPLHELAGQTVRAVRRVGKHIVMECTGGVLTIHLGMTGKLLRDGVRTPYTRVALQLDDCELLYDDVRQFGRISWSSEMPARIAQLGPDPLSISREEFVSRLRRKRAMIKPLLLNQRFLRGLGNIYVDESLFRAGIHPRAIASRISVKRAEVLHHVIQSVLALAIAHRGSSISDYVDLSGERGDFQSLHQVYGREGAPCPQCGTPVERTIVAQRGTHFCPRCQRR